MITSRSISIVIPIFNEDKILKNVLEKVVHSLTKITDKFEIILIENGSSDKSLIIANQMSSKNPNIKVKHLEKANYGLALKTGFKMANSDLIMNFSVDWVDFPFLKKAITYSNLYDIIIASKLDQESIDQRPFTKRMSGMLFHKFTKVFLGLPLSDTHGIRLVKRKSLEKIINHCIFGEEGFETEMLVRAYKSGLKILELPIIIKETRPSRSKTVKRAIRALYQLFKIKYSILYN